MDDSQIINLYFARDENAIIETKNKYQNMCDRRKLMHAEGRDEKSGI